MKLLKVLDWIKDEKIRGLCKTLIELTDEKDMHLFWRGIGAVEEAIRSDGIGIHSATGKQVVDMIKDNSFNSDILANFSKYQIDLSEYNNIDACILDIYNNTEFWIIRVHDLSLIDKFNISAFTTTSSCSLMIDDGSFNNKLVSICIIGNDHEDNRDVYMQVLRHEFTHFYLEYIEWTDEVFAALMDEASNFIEDDFIELLCDSLQFILMTGKSISENISEFIRFMKQHFKPDVLEKYCNIIGV